MGVTLRSSCASDGSAPYIYIHTAYPHCISILHIHTAYPYCISNLPVLPCCTMVPLHPLSLGTHGIPPHKRVAAPLSRLLCSSQATRSTISFQSPLSNMGGSSLRPFAPCVLLSGSGREGEHCVLWISHRDIANQCNTALGSNTSNSLPPQDGDLLRKETPACTVPDRR